MKDYCIQNNGDCETCSLVNYGRDCRNVPLDPISAAAHALGSIKSERKAAASRANAYKPAKSGSRPRGRPRKSRK